MDETQNLETSEKDAQHVARKKAIVQAEYRLSPNEIIEFRHRLNIANAIVKFVVEVFSGVDKCRQSIKAQPDSKVPKWCLGNGVFSLTS